MISHLAGGEMFGKRVWIAVLFVVTTMGASAVAQAEKNELGGILGRTFISDQGIKGANFFNPIVHSGNGLSFEGEYAWRSRRLRRTNWVGFLAALSSAIKASRAQTSSIPSSIPATVSVSKVNTPGGSAG